MIKYCCFITGIIAAFVSFNSCKNDFAIIAPYKDTTIVYGLLDPSDTVQYIRIHKAFVGEGNAYQYAQVPDSFYYRDILKVQLERWSNNKLISTINLVRDTSAIVKDTGVFVSYPNILYKTIGNDTIYNDYSFTTGQHSIYKLRIENLETGRMITSATPIVSRIYVSNPSSAPVNFTLSPYSIKWTSAYFGRVYDVIVRFHYSEAYSSNPFNLIPKYVDWHVGQKISSNINSSDDMQIDIGKESFFLFLQSRLKADPDIKRYADNVDFIFTAGADDLYTYYKINGFPSGLSQEIPYYTNINGGLGIFSSRYIYTLYARDLDNNTLSELINGIYTHDLNF